MRRYLTIKPHLSYLLVTISLAGYGVRLCTSCSLDTYLARAQQLPFGEGAVPIDRTYTCCHSRENLTCTTLYLSLQNIFARDMYVISGTECSSFFSQQSTSARDFRHRALDVSSTVDYIILTAATARTPMLLREVRLCLHPTANHHQSPCLF